MAQMTGETIRRLARENFDYEIGPEVAEAMAASIGALLAMTDRLPALGLDGIEPPFGYSNLVREAEALAGKAK
jgi:hypothetical protein